MGRQVYISDEHHTKLKIASAQRDKQMGEIIEEYIESMELSSWKREYI